MSATITGDYGLANVYSILTLGSQIEATHE